MLGRFYVYSSTTPDYVRINSGYRVTGSHVEVVTSIFREGIGQRRLRIRLDSRQMETGPSEKTDRSRFQRVHVRWKETLAVASRSNELSEEFDQAIRKLSRL